MHFEKPCSWILASLLLSSFALAQRTYIVDASNGQGTHFTTLSAAFAAVQDGDRLIVRRGTYQPAPLDKGIAILGEPGVVVQTAAIFRRPWIIRNIAPNARLRIRAITVDETIGSQNQRPLSIQDCKGSVHLDQVTVRASRLAATGPYFHIENCKLVTLRDCASLAAARIHKSHVDITGGQYLGTKVAVIPRSNCQLFYSARPAIEVSDSVLRMTACVVVGGQSDTFCRIPGASAISTRGGRVTLSTSTLSAGALNNVAVTGTASTVLVHDRWTQFRGTLRGVTTRREELATLTAKGGALGQQLDSELLVPKGQFWVLYLGLPWSPLKLLDFGYKLLDPRAQILLGAGATTVDRRVPFKLPIPNLPALRGLPLMQQGFTGSLGSGFRYSNAVGLILH